MRFFPVSTILKSAGLAVLSAAVLAALAGCGGHSSSESGTPVGGGGGNQSSVQGIATPTSVAVVTATHTG